MDSVSHLFFWLSDEASKMFAIRLPLSGPAAVGHVKHTPLNDLGSLDDDKLGQKRWPFPSAF